MNLQYLINNNVVEILTILNSVLCVASGICIFLTLKFTQQRWIDTYYNFLTFSFLPLITFIISKVIASNLALSLGLVGALSIVRFRNPVKNSFELVLYFALITIGIGYGVNWKWSLGLTIFLCLAIFIFKKINFQNTFFIDEGFENYSLNITSKINLEDLIENKLIKNYTKIKSEITGVIFEHHYVFCSDSKDKILFLYNILKEKYKNEIISLQLNV